MKKIHLGIVVGLALATTAYAETKESFETKTKGERSANGSYKTDSESETTDAAGTTRKVDINEKATVHKDGSKKVSMESKATTDPKGLMNKSTAERNVYGKTDAKGNYTGERSTDSVDANGREFSKDKDIKRKVKADGTVETSSKEKIVDDPRGLLNRSTGEVDTKTTKYPDGRTAAKTTKKIDGNTVEETNR
jgi:hypothetical protein